MYAYRYGCVVQHPLNLILLTNIWTRGIFAIRCWTVTRGGLVFLPALGRCHQVSKLFVINFVSILRNIGKLGESSLAVLWFDQKYVVKESFVDTALRLLFIFKSLDAGQTAARQWTYHSASMYAVHIHCTLTIDLADITDSSRFFKVNTRIGRATSALYQNTRCLLSHDWDSVDLRGKSTNALSLLDRLPSNIGRCRSRYEFVNLLKTYKFGCSLSMMSELLVT